MLIDGIEYTAFGIIEEEFDMKEGSLKRLVKKYNIKYKSIGRNSLLSDKDLTSLKGH